MLPSFRKVSKVTCAMARRVSLRCRLLARMVFCAAAINIGSSPNVPAAAVGTPFDAKRGMNTFPWMYRSVEQRVGGAPRSARYPNLGMYNVADFRALAALGIDFVRVPLDPSALFSLNKDQRLPLINLIIEELLKARGAGLRVILDLHPREAVPQFATESVLLDPSLRETYSNILGELAAALPRDNGIALEIMNEPRVGWGSHRQVEWSVAQEFFLSVIRAQNTMITVVLTGDHAGSVEGLLGLDPPSSDYNTLFSFHYYEPLLFTHQGTSNTSAGSWRPYVRDLPFPPQAAAAQSQIAGIEGSINAAQGAQAPQFNLEFSKEYSKYQNEFPGRISSDFDKVTSWASRHNIAPSRIIVGEFGASRPGADLQSATTYIQSVRKAAEQRGFKWAYWNFSPKPDENGFSVMKLGTSEFQPEILTEGLGLRVHAKDSGR